MDVRKVLLTNYLPYAKGTIIGRAIPSIDGLKPAQRRILYTMYTMGLINGNKTKSSNIVGQTMKLHPHGDMSIYETMIRMAVGNEALNTPYIDSKGNFGKVYSKDLAFAASRYTEAKLCKICKEMFDGIDEDAIDMVENFDNTTKEPTLLPVKFPSILVNPSNGIAVGLSSSIPSFALSNVCQATIDILKGKITNASELMDVLGVPEYTTGGFIHADKASLTKLGETGMGSFIYSGTVTTYADKIVINEIPYNTTAENIISAIEEHVKNGDLKEVAEVSDEIDIKGFRLVVMLKRGSNASFVLKKLCRFTPLRTPISYTTRVIIGDRCKTLGLLELLNNWIDFRTESLNRIYTFRKNKTESDVHILESWEKLKDCIHEVAQMITSNSEAAARNILITKYGLDETQADYILDMKTRRLTQDNIVARLKELANKRKDIVRFGEIIESNAEKYKIIIEDLERIIKTYGSEVRTHQAEMLPDDSNEHLEEEKVDDSRVVVITTKSGYIKRLASLRDITDYVLPDGEEEAQRFAVRNNEDILVFTYDGNVHKIAVNNIDASRRGVKDEIYKLAELANKNQVMLVDAAGDYSRYFNLVYPNGRGTRVYYNRAQGNRRKYKSLFDPCEPGKVWCTFSDEFFMITAKRKAAYCNLKLMGMFSSRVAFKVARVNKGDRIWGLQPIDKVPNISTIDISKYKKDYTVCINDDVLWEGANNSKSSEESTDSKDEG